LLVIVFIAISYQIDTETSLNLIKTKQTWQAK